MSGREVNLSSGTNSELAAGTDERRSINCRTCDIHTGWEYKTTTQRLAPTSGTKGRSWRQEPGCKGTDQDWSLGLCCWPVESHHRCCLPELHKTQSDLCVHDWQRGPAYSAEWKFTSQPHKFWCNHNFLLALKSLYPSSLREGIIIWKGLREKNKDLSLSGWLIPWTRWRL